MIITLKNILKCESIEIEIILFYIEYFKIYIRYILYWYLLEDEIFQKYTSFEILYIIYYSRISKIKWLLLCYKSVAKLFLAVKDSIYSIFTWKTYSI